MPFSTSARGPRITTGRIPDRSSQPRTRPSAGSMMAIRSVGQTFAPDVAFHQFQLVQAGDRQLAVPDFHAAALLEIPGIEETHFGAAVAHHEFIAQGCKAPALARIAEVADGIQGDRVAHDDCSRFPGQLIQPAPGKRQSFAEPVVRQFLAAQYPAAFEVNDANRRRAVTPGTLYELAIGHQQALGERRCVVGVVGDYAIGVVDGCGRRFRCGLCKRRREQRQCDQCELPEKPGAGLRRYPALARRQSPWWSLPFVALSDPIQSISVIQPFLTPVGPASRSEWIISIMRPF